MKCKRSGVDLNLLSLLCVHLSVCLAFYLPPRGCRGKLCEAVVKYFEDGWMFSAEHHGNIAKARNTPGY